MNIQKSLAVIGVGAAFLAAGSAFAQPNVVAGRNVKLQSLNTISTLGRSGTFPNGVNGVAESTTSCNVGSVNLPWDAAMLPNHPFISFIVARQSNGKFEQISDYSFVKHGFFATNSPGCGSCSNPGTGSLLGVNCADTYGTSNNGDNFWLGPADEINPWTAAWNPVCSHFDKGEPLVATQFQCDGVRSLSNAQAAALGSVGHRIRILDSDFNVPGSQFYAQGMYISQGEAESLRTDNMGWRPFSANWNGVTWALGIQSTITYNSVLSAWTGASLSSGTNGTGDGRVYVAVKVTGPTNGIYHYEYAVHNRDNVRGVSGFRIPVCSSATVLNLGFRDVDQVGTNQWSMTRTATEIAFTTTNNPLKWNSFYNFSFDSDAGPLAATVTLDAFAAGAGAPSFGIASQGPQELYNVNLGGACTKVGAAPDLHATGSPAKATLGNASFGLEMKNIAANSSVLLWFSALDGSVAFNPNCTLNMDVNGLFLQLPGTANGSGVANFALPIPSDPLLQGLHVNVAGFELDANGAVNLQADLSNTLRVRIGDALPGCP